MGNKILTVNEIINMSEADKINAYRQGYRLSEPLMHSNMLKLGTSDCIGDVQQGTTKDITVSMTSLGTPGYIYRLYIKEASAPNFTLVDTYPDSGTTNNTSHIFSRIFDEAVGSYVVKTEVVDSCINGALLDTSECTVNIVAEVPVLTSISITPTSASINIGSTRQLTATCKDQNNNAMDCPTLTWSSGNTSVATVSSSGLVEGIAEGSANITASYGDITSNTSAVTVSTVVAEAGINPLLMLAIGAGFLYAILKKK